MSHVTFITVMDPTARTAKFNALLKLLETDHSEFAEVVGAVRQQTKRWAEGDTKWNFRNSLEKVGQFLGLDYVQFSAYLDGTPLTADQLKRAQCAFADGLRALQERKAVKRQVKAVARKRENATGQPTIEGLPEFAAEVLWKMQGSQVSETITRRTVDYLQDAMAEILSRAEGELAPPVAKSSPEGSHVRASGTIRKTRRR